MKEALEDMKQVNSMDRLLAITSTYAQTLPGYFLSKNLLFLKTLLESEPEKRRLNDRECEFMQHHIIQTVDEMVVAEESYLSLLSTTAAASPLLGLFGTVWGIMDAFQHIGIRGSASLAVVAPGIAEALVATAVGLATAIPAVIFFNYFSSKLADIESEMSNFATDFLNLIERDMLSKV